jgi:hypothetical protein
MDYSKKTISILISRDVKQDIEEIYRKGNCKSFSCLLEDLIVLGLQEYKLGNGE